MSAILSRPRCVTTRVYSVAYCLWFSSRSRRLSPSLSSSSSPKISPKRPLRERLCTLRKDLASEAMISCGGEPSRLEIRIFPRTTVQYKDSFPGIWLNLYIGAFHTLHTHTHNSCLTSCIIVREFAKKILINYRRFLYTHECHSSVCGDECFHWNYYNQTFRFITMIMSQSTHPLSPRVASIVAKKTVEERTELINSVFSMLLKHNLQPPKTVSLECSAIEVILTSVGKRTIKKSNHLSNVISLQTLSHYFGGK